MLTRHLLLPPAAVILFAVLGACTQPSPVSDEADTARYHVQLDLDRATLGRRTATIGITDGDGRPVAAQQVTLSTFMTEMGMRGPTVVADEIEPSRYEATGDLFTMLGEWTLTVEIETTDAHEEATFTVEAEP